MPVPLSSDSATASQNCGDRRCVLPVRICVTFLAVTAKDKARRSKTKKPLTDTWTVRGVSPETREAVKKAARRSGMTMGAWLEENLRLAATDGLKQSLPAQRVEDQLASISGKLDAMQRPFWRRLFSRN